MRLYDEARRVLSPLCDERFDGFGVVSTDAATVGRVPRRRHHAREREQHRLAEVTREVADHLRQGGDAASAAQIVAAAGLRESIRITRGYAELVDAVVERFQSGDNVWSDLPGSDALVVLHFWHDSTHRRILDPYPTTRHP
jgi:hypothetical protein